MVVNLISATLLIVGLYFAWWSIDSREFPWLVVPAFLLLMSGGLFLRKRWGPPLWYVFALGTSVWWTLTAIAGFSQWPHEGVLEFVLSLVPGVSLLLFCVLGSIVVHRQFHRTANAP
jgi:hypothetical protein